MEALLALGEHAAAVGELERLAAAEPLRERRWELLIVALYRSGRQADALRAFAHARELLAEESGIELRPSLRALEADVLAHAPSLDWSAPSGRGAPEPAPPPARTTRLGLVGRRLELTALEATLDGAVAGSGSVVLVSGEPGIGKTRLVEEVAALATARGAVVAWGGCVEGEAPGFWSWAQVVRALAAGAGPDVVRAALGRGAAEVAQIVPELDEMGMAGAVPPVDLQTARLRLYAAVSAFLAELAVRAPLLVVLEDLQWADEPSLRLLEVLAGEVASRSWSSPRSATPRSASTTR